MAADLGALRNGNDPVHPEIVNLEVTIGDSRADHDRWLTRLSEAIRHGRARADAITLYHGALGEWLDVKRHRHKPHPDELKALRGAYARPSTQTRLWQAVAARLDPERTAHARALVAARCAEFGDPSQVGPIAPPRALLTPAGRADARSLPRKEGDASFLEFQAAFRLAWIDIAAWDWPESGVSFHPFWTGQRFRLRPRMDFLSATFVEAVGAALAYVVLPWSGSGRLSRALRLKRLEELDAPEVILENERRMLADQPDPLNIGQADLGKADSVRRARALQRIPDDDDGDYAYGQHSELMGVLWTEVRLAQAAGRPLHVFKTDIADFFPSVSHSLVDAVLAGMGVDEGLRALVQRVISVRRRDGTRTTCGLPLGLTLSRALAALVVDVVMSEVFAASGDQIEAWVLVDDIVLCGANRQAVDRAREALERGLGQAGLALNPRKTGSLAINAPATASDPVRWGLLQLGPEGWGLAPQPMSEFVAATRTHVLGQQALLDRVSAWRGQLAYLWTLLAPAAALGPHHFETVRTALEALDGWTETAEAPQGMVPMLLHELRHRFLGGMDAAVPQGWLHWPISAGGLGLPYPPADLVPLERAAARKPLTPPTVPCTLDDPAWGAWYAACLVPLEPVLPGPSPTLDAFVSRFIARGERLGQARGELSPYWRWVLTTFGPDVIDAFGSFEFVPPDLIPVGLIRESLGDRRTRPAGQETSDDDIPF